MTWRPRVLLASALLAVAPMAAVPAAVPGGAVPVLVTASPGATNAVVAVLRESGLHVTRRRGRDLQVTTTIGRLTALRAIPGVAAAHEAAAGYSEIDPDDPGAVVPGPVSRVISEGFERVGADAIQPLALSGRGMTIVVLDLGFGATRLGSLQDRGEMPPTARLQTQSFDTTWGLAGRTAYGNATNHGELVTQTLYDFAPDAHYVLVNYHTEMDFQAAVDWIIARHPDVVVHSNSFLEGPFDGTGPAARAVDRAAASGIAWINSAGNYAERHWEGEWADADSDGVLDWPITPGWTFIHEASQPMTFALSWEQADGAEVTDLDLVLERHVPLGAWTEVAASRDHQSEGARPSERITGQSTAPTGEYRVRVVQAVGPPPGGFVTLFSREIGMSDIGDPAPGSIPTPGDAAGSITVGAVDWTSDALKRYSSTGPTDDGRVKPDIVAPTNTRVLTATGPRAIGGTSNAAPNAAGAIVLLMGARRSAGAPLIPSGVLDLVQSQALDLGPEGDDPAFGAGRVRVDVDPPEILMRDSPRRIITSFPVRIVASVDDASLLASWAITVDGNTVIARRGESTPAAFLDRVHLPDGFHIIEVHATDWPGNVGYRLIPVVVDGTPPNVTGFRVEREAAPSARPSSMPGFRTARAVISVTDVGSVRATISLTSSVGFVTTRTVTFPHTGQRVVSLGPLAPGRYVARISARDSAGHESTVTRVIRVGP